MAQLMLSWRALVLFFALLAVSGGPVCSPSRWWGAQAQAPPTVASVDTLDPQVPLPPVASTVDRIARCSRFGASAYTSATGPSWVVMQPDTFDRRNCTIRVQCPPAAPFPRVVSDGRTDATVRFAATSTEVPRVETSAARLLRGIDQFGPNASYTAVEVFGDIPDSVANVLVLCYAAPCQSNVTVDRFPSFAAGAALTEVPWSAIDGPRASFGPATKLLLGERCTFEGPVCSDVSSQLPIPAARLKGAVVKSDLSSDFRPLGAFVPVVVWGNRIASDGGEPIWPPGADVDVGSTHASAEHVVLIFGDGPNTRMHIDVVGPVNVREEPRALTQDFSMFLQCLTVPCPSNGTLMADDDDGSIAIGAMQTINADCTTAVACRSKYRQLRLRSTSPCRKMSVGCSDVLERSTDPEFYHGTTVPKCSSTEVSFALDLVQTFGDYRCGIALETQCMRICNSPNRTGAAGEYLLTAVENHPSVSNHLVLITDPDGGQRHILPTWDSGCSWQIRCLNPGEFGLFRLTGRAAMPDLILVDSGGRGGTEVARVRTDQRAARMRVPVVGGRQRGLITFRQTFQGERSPMGIPNDQGEGWSIEASCITKTSFTCTVEPDLVWRGAPLNRSYEGDIPYIDVCDWRLRCPVGMFASASIDFTGGYTDMYYYDDEELEAPTTTSFDSTSLRVQNSQGNTTGMLRSGIGLVFSDDHIANVNFAATGVRTSFVGSYVITFDCWVTRCPFNATTPRAASNTRTMSYFTGDVYQNNSLITSTQPRPTGSAALVRNVVGAVCHMLLTCDAGLTSFFNFSGPSGRGGLITALGISGGTVNHTTATNIHDIEYGVFMHAPAVSLELRFPTLAKRQAAFDVFLGCSVYPCSAFNVADDVPAPRQSISRRRHIPERASVDPQGVDILREWRYYMHERCEINLECPAGSTATKHAFLTFHGQLRKNDVVVFSDPDDASGSRQLTLPTEGDADAIQSRFARVGLMSGGRRTRIIINTTNTGRMLPANSDQQFLRGSVRFVNQHCVPTPCPNNETQVQPQPVVLSPNADGSHQVNDLSSDGAPFSTTQPYFTTCTWHMTCPSPQQRVLVRYAAIANGNYTLAIGRRVLLTDQSGAGVQRSLYGTALLHAGEDLQINFTNPVGSATSSQQLLRNSYGATGLLFDARCVEHECVTVPDAVNGSRSSEQPGLVELDQPTDLNSTRAPVTMHALGPGAPPRWRADTRHDHEENEFAASPFRRYTALGENCTYRFRCDNANDTVHVRYATNETRGIGGGSPGDDELVLRLRATNITDNEGFARDAANPWDAFESSDFVTLAEVQAASQTAAKMGVPVHHLAIEVHPTVSGPVLILFELRCFVSTCCNNVSQPLLLAAGTPEPLRRPFYEEDPNVCDAETPGQNCTWVAPICESRLERSLVVHPETDRLRVVEPAPADLLGRSRFHALSSSTIRLRYTFDAALPTFPENDAVYASCFVCNVTGLRGPLYLRFPSVAAMLPFSHVCAFNITCDFEEYPRVSMTGVDHIASPVTRQLMRSAATQSKVRFVHVGGPNADGAALPSAHPLEGGRTVRDDLTLAVPPDPEIAVRGMYGIQRNLEVTVESHPLLSDPSRHAVLLDLEVRCERRKCIAQSPFPPADFGPAIGPPPAFEDTFGAYDTLPLFPRRVRMVPSMTAFGRQQCRWRKEKQCDAGCDIVSRFQLRSPRRFWMGINVSEQSAWDQASQRLVDRAPELTSDFTDSETGADYLRLVTEQQGAAVSAGDTSTSQRRARIDQNDRFDGALDYTFELSSTPSAMLVDGAFPAVEWTVGVESFSESLTASDALTETNTAEDSATMNETLSPSRDSTLSTIETESVTASRGLSPSQSPTDASPSPTVSASDISVEDIGFSLLPTSLTAESINGGIGLDFGGPEDRCFVIRANNTRFLVDAVLNQVGDAFADEYEARLAAAFDLYHESVGAGQANVTEVAQADVRRVVSDLAALAGASDNGTDIDRALLLPNRTQQFEHWQDDDGGAIVEEEEDGAAVYKRLRSEAAVRLLQGLDIRARPTSGAVPGYDRKQFVARRGELLPPRAVLHARGQWLVLLIQPDRFYFTARPDSLVLTPQPAILTHPQPAGQPTLANCDATIARRGPRSDLPDGFKTGVLSVVAGAALASMSPSSSLNFGRNEFLLQLGPCEFDPTEEPEFFDYPLGVGLTEHPLKFKIGQSIFNPVLIVGIAVAYGLVVTTFAVCTRQSHRAASAAVYFPSTLLLPALIIMDGTVTAAIIVVGILEPVPAAGTDDVAIDPAWRHAGTAGLCFVGFVIVAVVTYLATHFKAEISDFDTTAAAFVRYFIGQRQWINAHVRPTPSQIRRARRRLRRRQAAAEGLPIAPDGRHRRSDGDPFGNSSEGSAGTTLDDVDEGSVPPVEGLLAPPQRAWGRAEDQRRKLRAGANGEGRLSIADRRAMIYPDPLAIGFVERWGLAFDAYRPGAEWFLLVEITQLVGISAMTALAPVDGDCRQLTTIALGVFGGMLLLVLVLHPYLARADALFQTVVSTVQLAAVVFTFFGQVVSPRVQPIYLPVTEALVSLVSFGELFKAGADIYVHVKSFHLDPPPPTLLTAKEEKAAQKALRRDKAAIEHASTLDTVTSRGHGGRSERADDDGFTTYLLTSSTPGRHTDRAPPSVVRIGDGNGVDDDPLMADLPLHPPTSPPTMPPNIRSLPRYAAPQPPSSRGLPSTDHDEDAYAADSQQGDAVAVAIAPQWDPWRALEGSAALASERDAADLARGLGQERRPGRPRRNLIEWSSSSERGGEGAPQPQPQDLEGRLAAAREERRQRRERRRTRRAAMHDPDL